MSDNPHAVQPQVFALQDWSVVELSGPDAASFAQAQFMNDVAQLSDGHWQWSGWLTPKGRVIALFALVRLTAERILLVVADYPADALTSALSRFVFRAKVRVAASGLKPSGYFGSAPAMGNVVAATDDGFALAMSSPSVARGMVLHADPAPGNPDALADWRRFDLTHGLPRLAPEQREQWTPQQLSLERLGAYSVKKGCYPGQEIVARTHFLGKAKRGLGLFDCDGGCRPGEEIFAGDNAIGQVIAVDRPQSPRVALAVLPLDASRAGLMAGRDRPLVERPLEPGLER